MFSIVPARSAGARRVRCPRSGTVPTRSVRYLRSQSSPHMCARRTPSRRLSKRRIADPLGSDRLLPSEAARDWKGSIRRSSCRAESSVLGRVSAEPPVRSSEKPFVLRGRAGGAKPRLRPAQELVRPLRRIAGEPVGELHRPSRRRSPPEARYAGLYLVFRTVSLVVSNCCGGRADPASAAATWLRGYVATWLRE